MDRFCALMNSLQVWSSFIIDENKSQNFLIVFFLNWSIATKETIFTCNFCAHYYLVSDCLCSNGVEFLVLHYH